MIVVKSSCWVAALARSPSSFRALFSTLPVADCRRLSSSASLKNNTTTIATKNTNETSTHTAGSKSVAPASAYSSLGGRSYHEKVIVGYSREQMCSLVYDVAKYEEFVPFCVSSRVLTASDDKREAARAHASQSHGLTAAAASAVMARIKGTPRLANLAPVTLNLKRANALPPPPSSQSSTTNDTNQQESTTTREDEFTSHLKARLEVGFPPIKESYLSHVSMIEPRYIRSVSRDTDLFEHIVTEWKFHAYDLHANPHNVARHTMLDAARSSSCCCTLEFFVSFKFHSNFYTEFTNIFMDQIFKKMVSAFTKRAEQLYGKPSLRPKYLLRS